MKLSALYAIGLFMVSTASAWCDLSDDGNYYCGSTKKVSYANVGFSGSYDLVTKMDSSSGSCSSEPKSFSGKLSPLDEDLSLHFRGPIKLKQFGVYYPSSKSSKRKAKRDEDCSSTVLHKHHNHKRATQVVEVTKTVFVDGNGNTQTSEGTTTVSTDEAKAAAPTSFITTTSSSSSSSSSTSSAAATSSASSSSDDDEDEDVEAGDGDWERAAYYTPGSAEGCIFFNHHGGDGSGVWDMSFGNSISYASSDNSGAASSPVALDDVLIDSNDEYMIMSDEKCGDDCGYYRDGIPAYKGFAGKKKMFVFEFQMPKGSGSKTPINYDMPAIWALNAKIPRTLQYGKAECSCWPECGELDLFEILSAGSNKLISHLHSGQGSTGGTSERGGGGSQDYFERPYDSPMKAAVIFDGETISIVEVDDDFDKVLSKSTVNGWISESGSKVSLTN